MSEDDEGYFVIIKQAIHFFLAIFALIAFLEWLDYKKDMAILESTKTPTTGECRMTKKQLLDSLKDLSDDAVIYVEAFSDDFDIDHTADYVEVKDIVSGNDVENEATIAAYF